MARRRERLVSYPVSFVVAKHFMKIIRIFPSSPLSLMFMLITEVAMPVSNLHQLDINRLIEHVLSTTTTIMSSASPPSSPLPPSDHHNNGATISSTSNENFESHLLQQKRWRRPTNNNNDNDSSFLTSKMLLRILGGMLFLWGLSSLYLGSYYHVQHQDFTTTVHKMQQNKDDFIRRGDKAKATATRTSDSTKQRTDIDNAAPSTIIHETEVFKSVIERVKRTEEQCNNVPEHHVDTLTKSLLPATDLPPLPEGGVAVALERWLNNHDNQRSSEEEATTNNDDDVYPTCYIPPPKSCDVSTYTLVIMSHTTERLEAFMDPLADMVNSWPGLNEIIIVWNSPRTTLTSVSDEKQRQYAIKLLSWDTDPNHPLRIFFSLEEGLANNLLNRYHPKIHPKNEAVFYFDDDGPFFSKEAMVDSGFEMWKRNSNVQVGAFPRNIRYLSKRMKDAGKKGLMESIDIVTNNVHGDSGATYPPFTPFCRNATGDHVEYNYFTFPDYNAHMLLPSGSILHRNYLCFIWHPAFEELRTWVVHHKTMPDDMTVSTLVSHLSGRAPRTVPQKISTFNTRRRLTEDSSEYYSDISANDAPIPNQSHRRLLWKNPNWAKWREEAINSILNYFGSIHPGTVGWCAGTKYSQDHHKHHYECKPEIPSLNMIPWLNEGVGFDHCPPNDRVTDIIKETEKQMQKIMEEDKMVSFCGECKYKNFISCTDRAKYLIEKYNNNPVEAKKNTIKDDENCKKK